MEGTVHFCHRSLCASPVTQQYFLGEQLTFHWFSSREITVILATTSSYQRSENCASFTSLGFVPEPRTAPTCMISFSARHRAHGGCRPFLLPGVNSWPSPHFRFVCRRGAQSPLPISISFSPHLCPATGLLFPFCS